MNLSDKKYDAFISYRHGGVDQYIAENLHKKLEAFRLPKNILKARSENDKKRITRVFRDRDELPLASDLADPITNALRNSEFLIVICTKRLSESKWCMKEIETFIAFHGRDKIFAVLAEGEPQDSFPDILRYFKKIEVDVEGIEKEIEVEIEPLAADVRGKNNAERNKKTKEEVLRLAAPMFQLGYDDLRQRHREQILKRRILLASSIAVVGVTFATISTTLAFTIQKQSEKIAQQSEEIKTQYRDALIENNKNLAENALTYLKEGNVEQAIKTAVSALPKGEEDTEMPYVAQAEYALSQALQVYENGYRQMPAYLIDHESDVVDMELSPNGEKILSIDRYGNCLVWNPQNRKEVFRINLEESGSLFFEDKVHFVGDDAILYPTEKGLAIYDLTKQEMRVEKEGSYFGEYSVSKDQTLVVLNDMKKITLLDVTNLEEKGTYEFLEEGITITKSEVSTDLGIIAIAYRKDGEVSKGHVKVLNLADLSEKYRCTPKYESIHNIYIINNSLYVVANQNVSMSDALFSNLNGSIDCYDIQSGQAKWTYESKNAVLTELYFQDNATNDLFLALSYDALKSIHEKTGIEDYEFRYGSKVIEVDTFETGNFFVFTKQGEFHGIDLEKKMDFVFPERFISHSTNLNALMVGKNFIATQELQNPNICIYKKAIGSKVEEVLEDQNVIGNIAIDDEETRMLITDVYQEGFNVSIWNMKEKGLIKTFTVKGILEKIIYNSEKRLFQVFTNKSVLEIDKDTGEIIKEIVVDEYLDLQSISNDGAIIYYKDGENLIAYDYINKKVLKEIKIFDKTDFSNVFDLSEDESQYIVANKESKQIELYDADSNQIIVSKKEKVSRITKMVIDQESKKLFVVYKDGIVDVLALDTLETIKRHANLLDEINKIQKIENGYILSGYGMGYFLDLNFEIVAKVNNFECYSQNTGNIYMNDGLYKVLRAKRYSLTDLLEEANQLK